MSSNLHSHWRILAVQKVHGGLCTLCTPWLCSIAAALYETIHVRIESYFLCCKNRKIIVLFQISVYQNIITECPFPLIKTFSWWIEIEKKHVQGFYLYHTIVCVAVFFSSQILLERKTFLQNLNPVICQSHNKYIHFTNFINIVSSFFFFRKSTATMDSK